MKKDDVPGRQLTGLSGKKRELLKRLSGSSTRFVEQDLPVNDKNEDTGREAPKPLSFAQERMWIIDRMVAEGALYNITRLWRLSGSIQAEVLQAALTDVLVRHKVLRTGYVGTDDGPVQHVINAVFPFTKLDLRALPIAEQRSACERAVQTAAVRPFDLEVPPLARALLVQLGEAEHVLLVVMHHIASDGWSMGVFVRELSFAYAARSHGVAPAWLPLTADYQGYAIWQRRWLSEEVLDRQLGYWRKQLEGLVPLDLPLDHSRPVQPSYRGDVVTVQVSAELTASLKALARRNNVTLHMVLLSAFQTLLMRYSGQEDIPIGTPVAGRSRAEYEALIGFFVNTLVLRGDLSGNPRFTELLERTRSSTLDAYDHQDVPFEKLVSDLGTPRDLSRNPLFQVSFVLQNTPESNLEMSGLRADPVDLNTGTAKFDLSLSLTERVGGLTGRLEYSADLFLESTIERMAGHLLQLLEGIVADPDCRIEELPLLGEEDRRQFLLESAKPGLPETCPFPAMSFEQQVAQTPDRIAVRYRSQTLTFKQLNERANRLAQFLRSNGVGADSIVGLHMERSLELVVGMLAIVKAGGAYMPLDPSYPPERLEFMVREAGTCVVLSHAAVRQGLSVDGLRTFHVDDDLDLWAPSPTDNLPVLTNLENLAYVIFTSGSTGTPKGVMVKNRGICNHMQWMIGCFDFSSGHVFLQKTSISFDASVWEFLAPLMVGGQLVMADPGSEMDPLLLSEVVQRHGVTHLQVTPMMLRALLGTQSFSECSSLQMVFVGGDVLDRRLVQDFYQSFCIPLCNLYGPTEATIDTHYWLCDGAADTIVPIGRAIANTSTFVLDNHRNLVPIGIPGELYIGGDGLAKGYLNQPELTADRFVESPFAAGERLYRSGDRVRWTPNRELEYLGRIDHQVKLRGYRIEPGEIEAVIREDETILQCVVIVREDLPGDKRLVAYLVASNWNSWVTDRLRSRLKQRLPDFMIPTAFVELDRLPMTRSGKIDRQSLPKPSLSKSDQSSPDSLRSHGEPRTPVERQLVQIWCDVLGLEEVGIHDDFFVLGGHSILAARIGTRLRSLLKIEMPLRKIFEAPTIAELAVSLSGQAEPATDIDHRARSGDLPKPQGRVPLSFAQERMWIIDRMVGGRGLYNIPQAWQLSGDIQTEVLQAALTDVLDRHKILSTGYIGADDGPVQYATTSVFPFAKLDLQALPIAERRSACERALKTAAAQPFDLEVPPLARALLVQLGEAQHVLLVVMHHIASDGWSMGVFERELSIAYAARSSGHAPAWSPLGVDYHDYAAWHRQWLGGEVLARQLSYWRKQLEGLVPLELPLDHARPAQPSYRGDVVTVDVSAEVTAALKALARRHNVTMHMVLLSAFQTQLMRYSGQEDITIGTPVAGRSRPEYEDLIGFFVNTLVLRGDLSGNPRFTELLDRTRSYTLDAYDHQDVPFEKLVSELGTPRDLSHNPLFQVSFVLQNTPESSLEMNGLRAVPVDVDTETAKFDLGLSLTERSGRLVGKLEYSTDLFDPQTIARMAGQFQYLLAEIVVDPECRVDELSLLGEVERRQMLMTWNDTSADVPHNLGVHELFEAQVVRTPQSVAVLFEDQRLTYLELNERSNKLAHHLLELGADNQALVGLLVDRSLDLMVGILGVLKAGAAYVPLDPNHPTQRLEYILQDSGVRYLVTQRRLLTAHYLVAGDQSVCLDEGEAWQRDPLYTANPCRETGTDDRAYVMYTSGSTGQPKGVQVPHRAVVNLLLSMAKRPGITSGDRLLSVTTPTFDISVLEFLLPLSTGASVEIASFDLVADPAALSARIERSGATIMQATPTTWQMLVNHGWLGSRRLKILCGGETLPEQLATDLLARSAALWNMYGPTETTIWSTIRQISGSGDFGSIGGPIANTQIYVLDSKRQPVPIGVPGELYIGGAGVSLGYLNRSELTAEKFLTDPFSADSQARLYRTGDLVRWRASGDLEFQGRLDDQVKLRGFRIELGEIESALNAYPEVRQSVVLMREDRPGDKRLVAYLVSDSITTNEISDVRSYLRARLPEYMLPAACVVLEALPLTSSGKIDRRALPAPEVTQGELVTGFVGPRSPIEDELEKIWCEVLGVERVGIHDNFFEIGGHSLLAVRIVARLQSNLHLTLALRDLFSAPTISSLAARLDVIGKIKGGLDLSWARADTQQHVDNSTRTPTSLSFAQERIWFLEQMQPEDLGYNMPNGLRLRGPLDVEALRRSIEEIIRRHEPLRTNFGLDGDQPVQFIQPIKRFELPQEEVTAGRRLQLDPEIFSWCQKQANARFDLVNGVLIRASLLRIDDNDHVLMMVVHHIACDGWSSAVLFHELSVLYEAFRLGNPSTLTDLPIRYSDYSRWQRERLHGDYEARLIDYWRERLRDAPPLIALPVDWPRREYGSNLGARCRLQLSSELTKSIGELGRQSRSTTFALMMATFQLLLSRLAGQLDIVVGIPVAGRTLPDHEPLIGLFLNVLVIRTDLRGNQTFRELLKQVHDTALDAYEHQDLPFERLVEILSPERSTSHSPLVQVLFNGVTTQLPHWQSSALSIEEISSGERPSKYDLTVYVQELSHRLQVSLVYNPDLFSADRMNELLDQYLVLLEQVVANPDRAIEFLGLLTPKSDLLLPNPGLELAAPLQKRVTDHIERVVKRMPNQVAISCGTYVWSYAQLWSSAQRFADQLREHGVVERTAVAVYGSASFGLISTVVGLLHSGAVLVLIDPKLPLLRQQCMVDQAGCTIIAVVGDITSDAQELAAHRPLIGVNGVSGNVTDNRFLDSVQTPRQIEGRLAKDAAYIFFTSGTTGTPKGVVGSHAGLSHFITWQRDQFEVGPSDRIAQVTGISFDVVMREIFLPLTSGARLCIPNDSIDDPSVFWPWLDQQGVTIVHGVPSRLQNWLSVVNDDVRLRDFRLLFMAGEPLSHTLVHAWRSRFAGDIVNLYGPTETTLAKSWYRVRAGTALQEGIQPIGGPLPQTQLLLMRSGAQRCGVGELGEIVIRTPFRSLGYLDVEQTRERFRPNPFGSEPCDLLYYTGDLGRYRPDGVLEIAGRLDDQIKIGGVRVEPAEIGSVLATQPDIAACHVGVVTGADGEKRLVAWVVPHQGQPHEELAHQGLSNQGLSNQGLGVELPVLQKFLASRLPSVMVPARFVLLDSMPVTPNGKVDRRRLPLPDESRPDVATAYVAPRSELERQLSMIWSQVLGVPTVGIHDNFFALGGHSLLATRVVSRIRSTLAQEVALRTLFEGPTIAELAQRLDARDPLLVPETTPGHFLSIVRPLSDRGNVICVGGHVVEWLHQLPADVGIIFLGSGSLEPRRFHRFGIAGAVTRYLKELAALDLKGRQVVVGYSYSGLVAYALCARLRQVIATPVDVVLLEPSLPGRRQHPARAWIMRLGRYVVKLFRHGPSVIVNSVRRRQEERLLAREAAPVVDDMAEWKAILPGLRRNMARYRPEATDSRGIHLVAGSDYLDRGLARFRSQLVESPQIHDQGNVTHQGLVEDLHSITKWRQLIVRILAGN